VDYLKSFTYFTFILPLLVYLFHIKRNNNTAARVIFLYLSYTVANEFLMVFLKISHFSNAHPNSLPILYALYTIIESLFLSYYLYISFKNNFFKKSLLVLSIVFVVIALFNLYTIVFQSSTSQLIDTIPVSTSALILMIFSILYLFEEIQTPKIGFVYSKPNFWIVVGIMIYFSGTFFLFLQYSALSNSDKDNFWIINIICIILKNIFFSISFMLPKENETSKDLDNSYLLKNLDDFK
jgi:hypothetical protein